LGKYATVGDSAAIDEKDYKPISGRRLAELKFRAASRLIRLSRIFFRRRLQLSKSHRRQRGINQNYACQPECLSGWHS